MGRANYLPSPLARFKLNQFGEIIRKSIGETPYLVGSCLEKPDYRDVDIRIIMDDEKFKHFFGDEEVWLKNPRLKLANMALSALAKEMTGLEIDCQIQQMTEANTHYSGMRNALFIWD